MHELPNAGTPLPTTNSYPDKEAYGNRHERRKLAAEMRHTAKPTRPQVAQPRLSQAQVEALIKAGEAALPAHSVLVPYRDLSPANQQITRRYAEAIAYAIMDNPRQFTPRTMPKDEQAASGN